MSYFKFDERYYTVPSSIYVNPTLKWVWLRNHKAAGSSIYHAIESENHPDFIAQTDPKAQVCSDSYDRWKQWMDGGFDTDEYYIFMITRDPYDRFASACRYLDYTPSQLMKYLRIWRGNTREWRHTRPQTHYLFDHTIPMVLAESREVVGYSQNYMLPEGSVDLVDINDLDKRWNDIHKRIGANKMLTHLNMTVGNPLDTTRDMYNKEFYDFVNSYYREDFEKFGYKIKLSQDDN